MLDMAAFIVVKNDAGVEVQSYSGIVTQATGVRETIPVSFTLPAGSNYSMGFSVMPDVYRNTAGATFPYTVPGEISITGHSFSGYPSYFYYFYNWNVTSAGCESAPTEAIAVVTGQPDVDAGVLSVQNPVGEIPLGTENIEVEIINYGIDTLTATDIAWTVNGVAQTPFAWTGSLLTGEKDTVVIGSYAFGYTPYPGLNNLVVWTENPNAVADTFNANDTVAVVIDANALDGAVGLRVVGLLRQAERIVQEALSNARKHGAARHVEVTFTKADGHLHLSIQDDGRGFDPQQVENRKEPHYGLQFMRERAGQLNGSLMVQSAPGAGTRCAP